MRRLIFVITLLLITSSQSDAGKINYRMYNEVFYESLSPFGEWIEIDYDLVVWRPINVDRHWAPYKKGQWLWTNDGWYWDSYEPFGWATYHYGRWHYDDYYGWLWFPDTKWAPAWVEWRYNDTYVGWAPLSPYAKFQIGFGIRFTRKWHHHHHHWHFVSINRFHGHDVHNHIIHSNNNHKIIERTKYRTNYYNRDGKIINGGVNRDFVERRSGNRIKEKNLVTTRTNFNRNDRKYRDKSRIDVFKPDFSKRSIENGVTRTQVNITKNKRSINIDREKVVTRRSTSQNESGVSSNRSIDRRREIGKSDKSVRSESSRSIKRERKLPSRSGNVERPTSHYDKKKEIKRHSRKSSGRANSAVRESSQNRASKNAGSTTGSGSSRRSSSDQQRSVSRR